MLVPSLQWQLRLYMHSGLFYVRPAILTGVWSAKGRAEFEVSGDTQCVVIYVQANE